MTLFQSYTITESPFEIKSIIEEPEQITYGLELIKAREVWESSKQGEGIVIAVLDTGCDTKQPDLAGARIGMYKRMNRVIEKEKSGFLVRVRIRFVLDTDNETLC